MHTNPTCSLHVLYTFVLRLALLSVAEFFITNIHLTLTAPDGTHELFVGLTDRVVGAFRWNEASSSLELRQKWILTGQVFTCTMHVCI